jgi:hypothetical protein
MTRKEYKVEGVEKNNPNNFGGMCSRAITLERKSIDFEKGIETIATTEAPALVVDWERYQIVREILPMRYREAPTAGKVPLLDSHNRSSVDKIKGSASDFKSVGANLMCRTYISASEPIVRQKISEGHIDSVSIGYMTERDYTVEIPKGASVVVDGIAYRNDYEDGYPMVVRTWWQEHELSLVPIGADEAAKFKSANTNEALLKKVEDLTKENEALKAKDNSEKSEAEQSEQRGLTYHEAQVRLLKHL